MCKVTKKRDFGLFVILKIDLQGEIDFGLARLDHNIILPISFCHVSVFAYSVLILGLC